MSDTDRELLEFAAKAAGMNAHRYCEPWRAMAAYTLQDGYHGPSWNPLTDDGDALRLAVKLGIRAGYSDFTGEAEAAWDRGTCRLTEYGPSDQYAATRRAIVRAAAQIGWDMQ